MNYNLVEIYKKLIDEGEKQTILSSHFQEKPIESTGIITPDSRVTIQPMFGIEFQVDKEGMEEILKLLEEKIQMHTEEECKNLLNILVDIYTVTEEYFGGHGNEQNRINAYLSNADGLLRLSDIYNKRIGLCAERASVAQNCLAVLEELGMLKSYVPTIVNSKLMVAKDQVPHSFIILKNKDESRDSYLFDIENPITFKENEDSKQSLGIGLFVMTPEEYEKFKDGETVKLKSIYEKSGMTVIDNNRQYGNKQIQEIKEGLQDER